MLKHGVQQPFFVLRCRTSDNPRAERLVAEQPAKIRSPLGWTNKSVRRLAEALRQQGHQVSRTLVAELLNAAGYSLQGDCKTKEGDSHPDRDVQFAHINTQVAAALAEQQPVISVDTKKKELVGDFRTMAASIARKAIRNRSGCMTS